ncbi:MAG TPA: oligosaccharide flippase family protein [Burkholderiales bacterium]|nr:oligosaccharide flippase family protein [Burkholderiales bacterium]
MNAAARAIAAQGLARRAFSLGAVKAFDQALQFLLPVVLVRCLDTQTFGEYRLLWLAVGTVMALAPLSMPGGLYYFMPRSDAPARRLYVHQTLLFLACTGLASAFIVSPLNPWLPTTLHPLAKYGALVPAFVALWVSSCLLDFLPTIEERIPLQAFATISVALARAALVAGGAWLTGDMSIIVWLLLATVLLKFALLLAYIGRFHGWAAPWFKRSVFAGQFRYTAPFGLSSACYVLRSQADQWVAATLFTLHSFASFSIAAILGQVVNIFRQSVVEAFMPSMSRLEASGDARSMMEMNARANAMVGALLLPLLGFVFAFAEDLVSLVYTASYVNAAAVMRVYIVGLAVLVVELSTVMQLLRQGPYSLAMNIVVLVLSVPLSWYGGVHLGLAGAAAGSVSALYIDRAIVLRRIAAITGVPVHAQQHWSALARCLVWSAAAALTAWLCVHALFAHAPLLVRLAAGAVVITLIYAPFNLRHRP